VASVRNAAGHTGRMDEVMMQAYLHPSLEQGFGAFGALSW
jgi:hypothetical protein